MQTSDQLLIGAHTSIAGGVHNALLEGKSIGATTIQLFTANQRQWRGKPISPDSVELFKRTLAETGLHQIMSHDSYLINLGAPDSEILHKSRAAFKEEISRCLDLGITYLNFHPGAAVSDSKEACLDRIVVSLIEIEKMLVGSKLRLLLEATAGQGTAVGSRFEELAYIIERVKQHVPIGVCIDTCHIFVAGYDIRSEQSWNTTLQEFDRIIGLKHLYAFHCNDSMKDFGSHVDRHAPIGEGKIGFDSFKFLMTDSRTREIPKYLETPDPARWSQEIQLLRDLGK